MQKAVVFENFGPPSVLHLVEDCPKPICKKDQCLVKIHSTSVNPIDWKTRKGEIPKFLVKLPKVLGGDIAGVVVEGSSRFPPGTRVFSCTDGFLFDQRLRGSYCEYAAVPEHQLAVLPDNIPLDTAGAIPLVSLTAWQALENCSLQPGQRILIQAGAGGVGSMCVQLAKARDLYVVTTCSTRNIEFCKTTLGADLVIDYTKESVDQVLANDPVDAVIDLIGGSVELASMAVLKKSGVFVNVLNSGWAHERGEAIGTMLVLYYSLKYKLLHKVSQGPKYVVLFAKGNGAQLAEIAGLLKSGKVKPEVEMKMPLEKAAEAHEHVEKGHTRGKVVLVVVDE